MGKDVPQLPGESREPAPRQGPPRGRIQHSAEKSKLRLSLTFHSCFSFLCPLRGELLHPEGLAGMG